MLSVSALRAADKIIILLQCEHFSIEGLAAMQRTIIEINEATGSKLKIDGILRTMFDQEKERAREISEKLEQSLFSSYSAPLSLDVTCLQRLLRRESQLCTLIQMPKAPWLILRLLAK